MHETADEEAVATDHEGMIVCRAHGERRYGWRSLPARNFTLAEYSPREIERLAIFGEARPERVLPLQSSTKDTRDNRDPETLGREILAKNNGK